MDADPPMSTAPLAAPETPRLPEGPRPFARWLTVLATLAVAGLFVAGIWARRAGGGAGLDRGRAAEARADRPSAEQRHPRLKYVEAAGLVIGLGAAGLLGTRRRRPRQAPPELPAPWPRGDLYAALVRCLFWSFLITTVVAAEMGVARHPPRAEEITLLVYVLGVLAVAYHLANGLQTFAMGQGVVASSGAVKRLEWVVYLVFILLLAMGWGSVYALWHAG